MNKIKTIIKYELIRYFTSPIAYVYLISFLLLSGSLAIYFGDFFNRGQANLWSFFDYQPWVYLLFIPGIAMRSWSEEFKSKTIIQLLSMPLSLSEIVWGKFLASWCFAGIALLLTFPFWITVNILGTPDNTVILIGYIGCFVLCGAMLAISQTMSAVTKNPVIALVLAVFVNLMFFWSSFEYILFWARELFSDVVVDTIISFSFLIRFFSLSRGLVELRDLIYFGSLIVFFNILTIFIIGLKTKGISNLVCSIKPKHSFVYIALLFIGFFGINIIANNAFRLISYDFTEEKHLSLTKNTKDILRNLRRPVVAKLYYSPILEQRNPNVRQIFDKVKLMLKQYKSYAGGNFDYKIYNPVYLGKDEDKALADGLQPIPLVDINQNALFGVSFSDSLMNKSVIPFIALERLGFLEQDFSTAIYKLHHKKKTVGVLSSLPIYGGDFLENVLMKKWEVMNLIDELYDVKLIKNEEDLNQKFDVFMLIHPQDLPDSVIEKIKEQEKIFLVLDVADDASMLYSPVGGSFIPSKLGKLADYWGIDFYDLGVAADFDNSITVDETKDYNKNPSFTQDLLQFRVGDSEFNPNHRITYKLNDILFSTASMVFPKEGADVSFFPLIRTSSNSSFMDAEFVIKKKSPREILENFSPSNGVIVLAAEFLSNNPRKPFDIIAVADSDIMYDAFWSKETNFLNKTYHIPMFDNANFVLNALDYLAENDDLIALRGKSVKNRPFYKIDNMRKLNTYRYKLRENDIFHAIDGAKQNLNEIIAKASFEERNTFNADELALIGGIRKEIAELKHQLSNLKINANNDIKRIEIKVKFFNIYFVSLIIVLAILLFNIKNKNISFGAFKNIVFWNKNLLKLIVIVGVISGIAGFCVYLDNHNNISTYEGKFVFKDFNKKINNIKTISLKDSKNELNFVKENGVWKIDGDEKLPLYQERIRSFLVNLSNMIFYEKKSDKVEDMKYFGFSPLENKNSPMIEVTLKDENGKNIERFDIGWHDIDLGRDSKASFIRFENQFQVWMVDVDFYDLSLEKELWTYSSLWNLRFGRFISYNDINDEKDIMNIVKTLINTTIIDVKDDVDGKLEGKITINAENSNDVELLFYSTKDNKFFVKYKFLADINGKHLKFFADSIKDKFVEISEDDWKKLKNDIISK